MKSYENEFKIILQYHIEYFRMSHMNFDKSWIMNYGSTVHHCAKRKTISIICVATLHSLPWNITSKAHKIRTTLKRRWIFNVHRETVAFTMWVSPGLLEMQQRRQQQSCFNTSEDKVQLQKRKASSRGQHLDYDSWMTYVEKILFETLIFKYVYFDTMTNITAKKREQRLGDYTSSVVNGGVYKIPKLTGKRIHVWASSQSIYRRSFKSVKWGVLNLLVRNAETNFGRQSLSHHYVPVSTLEDCVLKGVKENGEENCSQDNLRLERTRCNTPKYLRAQEFRRLRVAIGRRGIYKDKQ